MDLSYVLYDTAVFGTTALFENTLFQVAQGGDSTHTESFTNSRGAGQLPANESFKIKRILATIDVNGVVADSQNTFIGSFVDIIVNNRSLFKAPLTLVAARNGFGGMYTQAAAANESLIGLMGEGYTLEIPIMIDKGSAFKVRVVQGVALSAASQNVKLSLDGILNTPAA